MQVLRRLIWLNNKPPRQNLICSKSKVCALWINKKYRANSNGIRISSSEQAGHIKWNVCRDFLKNKFIGLKPDRLFACFIVISPFHFYFDYFFYYYSEKIHKIIWSSQKKNWKKRAKAAAKYYRQQPTNLLGNSSLCYFIIFYFYFPAWETKWPWPFCLFVLHDKQKVNQ